MSYTRPLVVIAFAAMLAMILGCSGSSPVTPQNEAGSMDSLPVIGLSEAGDVLTGIGMLGMFELQIDPETMTADMISKRTSAAIGDSNLVSGLPFFTMSAFCKDCLKITGLSMTTEGNAALSFILTHPFNLGSSSSPPSAVNRRDLDVFDAALVIKPIGATATTYSGLGVSIYDTICVDAAGYTKEIANLFSPADTAAMPFFLVVDNSIGGTSTYNKFGMGTSSEFDVVFNLSGGILKFDMYLTLAYGAAAAGKDKPSFLAPKYFNPEYNRKNAWKVVVTPPTEAWKDNENDPGDTRDILVDVYDWQVGATVSTDWANETTLTRIREASEITSVAVDVLGATATVTTGVGTGTPADPVVFTVPLANTAAAPAGTYTGVVKVTDSRTPATTVADGWDTIIDTPDAVVLTPYLIPEFATYQTFPAEVEIGCGPIVLGTVTGCPVAPVADGTTIDFTIAASSLFGDPLSFEMDADYDGVTFDVDYGPNATGIFNAVPFHVTPCVVGTELDVAVRVTDSCPIPNVSIFDICTVEIGSCCGPINGSGAYITTTSPQNIVEGDSIAFVVGGVTSALATITYYADLNWDGNPANFDRDISSTTGTFAPYTFLTDGTYFVGFQAEDSCSPPGVYTFTSFITVVVVNPPVVLPYVWDGDVDGGNLETCAYTSPGFTFITANNCYDENGSLTTAYPAYANTWVATPIIQFPSSGTIMLYTEFYGYNEGGWDGVGLGYTTNGGTSWTINSDLTPWLTQISGYAFYTSSSWYGMTYSTGCGTPGVYSSSGWYMRRWAGTSSLWNYPYTFVNATFQTSGLNGLFAQIGFIFKADSSVQYYPGFGVNRIYLYAL